MKHAGALIALLLAAASCAHERPAPVPRPRAYPRAALYPQSYSAKAFGAVTLSVNDSAKVSEPRSGWFDIDYPTYGITINCTLTPVDSVTVTSVLDNRTERMARNIEGRYGEVMSRRGVTVVTSMTSLRTPVQFLATDSASYVLSGVAVANFPADAAADSVAPYVKAIETDVIKLLERL